MADDLLVTDAIEVGAGGGRAKRVHRTAEDLLRVAAATDAAEMIAEIDSVLRNRETCAPEEEATASVENILAHMSAYMEAPAAA